jgi:hypothetical protein
LLFAKLYEKGNQIKCKSVLHQFANVTCLTNIAAKISPLRQPVRTPVLVNPESFIQFWCKSSATAENRLQYLQDNLGRELNTLHNITLYVWVGTSCNN